MINANFVINLRTFSGLKSNLHHFLLFGCRYADVASLHSELTLSFCFLLCCLFVCSFEESLIPYRCYCFPSNFKPEFKIWRRTCIVLVAKLATRWCHLDWMQIWPPGGATWVGYPELGHHVAELLKRLKRWQIWLFNTDWQGKLLQDLKLNCDKTNKAHTAPQPCQPNPIFCLITCV